MPKTRTADLCYVYCVIEGAAQGPTAAGMPEGQPPRALPLGEGLAAIVSDVPARIYAADALEPRLSDLDWVATAGGAHHAVIDALADAGAVVLPFRLFTLFSSTDTALQTLRGTREAMMRACERVRGKQEWVLRIGKPDPAAATSPAPAPRDASTRPGSRGTSFLQAKADAKRQAALRAQRVREDAAAAFAALEPLADAARSRDLEPGGNLLVDAAFLVEPNQVETLREELTRRATRLLEDGCPVSLTGPWPPYSFASVEPGR